MNVISLDYVTMVNLNSKNNLNLTRLQELLIIQSNIWIDTITQRKSEKNYNKDYSGLMSSLAFGQVAFTEVFMNAID